MRLVSNLVLTIFIGLPLLAQISSPRIGTARYPDGSFHSVQGLTANLVVGDLSLDPAQAASFSDAGGLVAQNGAIRLLGTGFAVLAEYPVAEKPLLSIDGDLTSALAWLPNAHTLLHWNGAKFDALEVAESDIEGTVTDLQPVGSKQARLIVQHTDHSVSGVIVSLRTGNLVSSEPLPGARGYTVGQGFFVVYAEDQDLVVDNLRGYRRTVSLPAADFAIERMSNSWLHVYSPALQQNWVLHLTSSELQLSILPGLSQKSLAAVAGSSQGGK